MIKNTFIVLVFTILFSGCVSSYTSIMKEDDQNYLITRVDQGVFSVSSELYKCSVNGSQMTCTQIAEE